MILLLVITFGLSAASSRLIANRSCALRAPRQPPRSAQSVLQAVPSLHHKRFGPARHCAAAIAAVLGRLRISLPSELHCTAQHSAVGIFQVYHQNSLDGWLGVQLRLAGARPHLFTIVLPLSILPFDVDLPSVAPPPRHRCPLLLAPADVLWRAGEVAFSDCNVLVWMSSAHDLMSLTSNGAASGVPHPCCLGSSFFRTSLISSSMTSVSANFRRGSAQAIGRSLRLLSGSSPFVERATILTLVQSFTVSPRTDPRNQRFDQFASSLGPSRQPRYRCHIVVRQLAGSRRCRHAEPLFVWARSSASMSIAARFAISSFVAAVGGAASFPSSRDLAALSPPPPIFLRRHLHRVHVLMRPEEPGGRGQGLRHPVHLTVCLRAHVCIPAATLSKVSISAFCSLFRKAFWSSRYLVVISSTSASSSSDAPPRRRCAIGTNAMTQSHQGVVWCGVVCWWWCGGVAVWRLWRCGGVVVSLLVVGCGVKVKR